ncbi:putative sugar nucleotidyl transferase [Mucisphaera calidilacus]|uniref:Bifunctional N-acetylglucosamine-1-phosphate uridyltransferase/glucosamine-1-phosphate acetyltransferase n=1 Tax=Mucisphaera calidilacus TaxID=2527982 RepID=A0A518C0W3_9BACT|nr:putative sugar nucleotidyl transferase [Mucisphaera calidilacus]QDU72863.1 bifunctional N-acetylglucosamine-1-phosphate uridyltransferase/glucosamine-1-phosphate acetyltransferase [Mucisphaera calidilacus]
MANTRLLVYDDDRGQFGPLRHRRAIFATRTGALEIRQRIERQLGRPVDALWMPMRYQDVSAPRYPASVNSGLEDGDWLIVNGRWNGIRNADEIRSLEPGQVLVEPDGQVVAAHVTWIDAGKLLESSDPHTGVETVATDQEMLMERPWDVFAELGDAMAYDLKTLELSEFTQRVLEDRCRGVVVVGDHPVKLGQGAKIGPNTVLDTSGGAIVIDDGASVGANCVIEGPVYVGRHTVVGALTSLRPNVSIGPFCRVSGEVSYSVIQAWSNKAHYGYLGHSLVGQWCNLGAGTSVSNLKNTYTSVRMQLEPGMAPEDTGHTFLGPVLGDFVRTAIGTRIMTGSCISTGCMIARSTFAPKYAAPFGFYTDAGRQHYEFDKFMDTAATVMARRDHPLFEAEIELLRRISGEPAVV